MGRISLILGSAVRGSSCVAQVKHGRLTLLTVSGDETKLLMALLACLLGYGEVGLWLKKEAAQKDSWVQLDDNPYLQWINDYSGEHYQGAVKLGLGEITHIPKISRC